MRAVLSLASLLLLAVLVLCTLAGPDPDPLGPGAGRETTLSILVGSRGHMLPRARREGSVESLEDSICVGDLLLNNPVRELGLAVALMGPEGELLSFETHALASDPAATRQLTRAVQALPPGALFVASVIGDVRPAAAELAALDQLCTDLGARVSPFRAPRASWALIAARLEAGWVTLAEAYSEERAVDLAFTLTPNLGAYQNHNAPFFFAKTAGEQRLSLYHSRSSLSQSSPGSRSAQAAYKLGIGKATFYLKSYAGGKSKGPSTMHWESIGLGSQPRFESSLSLLGPNAPALCRLLINGAEAARIDLDRTHFKAWNPWSVDLSAWSGQEISLTLESSTPGASGQSTSLWGDARLIYGSPNPPNER